VGWRHVRSKKVNVQLTVAFPAHVGRLTCSKSCVCCENGRAVCRRTHPRRIADLQMLIRGVRSVKSTERMGHWRPLLTLTMRLQDGNGQTARSPGSSRMRKSTCSFMVALPCNHLSFVRASAFNVLAPIAFAGCHFCAQSPPSGLHINQMRSNERKHSIVNGVPM
jgi:hypothetical protein